jgi:hypothetical protein
MLRRSICFQLHSGPIDARVLFFESGLAQPSNLFRVMQSVHYVKFSPLASSEGSEDRMVKQLTARAQCLFAARNAVVHFDDL